MTTRLTPVQWMLPLIVRPVLAAGSGITFCLASGIWTDHPEARNWVWHRVAWTITWAPCVITLTWENPPS